MKSYTSAAAPTGREEPDQCGGAAAVLFGSLGVAGNDAIGGDKVSLIFFAEKF
jgi:hypothetical protein